MKTYLIYRAFNVETGECYIGRTSSTLNKRRMWHYSNAARVDEDGRPRFTNAFAEALRQTPKDLMEWETLEEGLDRDTAFEREAYYIRFYRAEENGYNMKPSDLVPWNKGKQMSEEYCDNLRGENNGMFGKTHTPEYRAWRSKHMSECQNGASNTSARRVRCVETGEMWGSVIECAKATGIGSDNIAACCRPTSRNKSAGGLHFEYADEKRAKRMNVDKRGGKNPKARRVRCVETGKEWSSMSECAAEIGVSESAISAACRIPGKRAKGFRFEKV